MKFYTIQNNNILIAETEQALSKFYNNVKVLPDDYVEGKYILDNNRLVINSEFETEQSKKEKQISISDIKQQLLDIDTKRIRAMCEPSERDDGQDWLTFYNEQAQTLRAELQELENIGDVNNDDNTNE